MRFLAQIFLLLACVANAQSLDELTRPRDATSARVASNSPHDWSNADNRWIKPGETFTLADIKGPGVIRHIWFTFPEANASWIAEGGSAAPDEIVLRMYWDGAEEPAVESPLGDFFACGFGQRAEVRSIPVQVQGGDSYNCFWPMPFFRSALLTVTNESDRTLAALYYQIDYTQEASLPEDSAYFCAQYRQEFPAQMGRDYLIADIEAPLGGHYVGTVMSVRSRSPQWWGEGDEKFYLDGAETPTIWGTGTEDYFLNAWGMQKDTFPSFGVSRCDGSLGELGDTGTMYRWHTADPVRFRTSLRFEVEHKGWISADETTTGKIDGHVEREDDFSTVAFWYQRGQPKRFATLPPASARRLPSIDIVVDGAELLAAASSEGAPLRLQKGGLWTGEGQLFVDASAAGDWVEFGFTIPGDRPRNILLPLTRSYDFGTYQVLLDGKPAGPPVDAYSPEIKVVPHRLGELAIAPGAHVLRLECVGANQNSSGFRLGIDGLRLRERHTRKRVPLDVPQDH